MTIPLVGTTALIIQLAPPKLEDHVQESLGITRK